MKAGTVLSFQIYLKVGLAIFVERLNVRSRGKKGIKVGVVVSRPNNQRMEVPHFEIRKNCASSR